LSGHHVPERTCVGCRRKYAKSRLLRFVATEQGLSVGPAEGRGQYLCKDIACYESALKRKCLREAQGGVAGDHVSPLRQAVAEAQARSNPAGERQIPFGTIGGGAIG
jgi:uncharacterized protein